MTASTAGSERRSRTITPLRILVALGLAAAGPVLVRLARRSNTQVHLINQRPTTPGDAA